MQPTVTQGAGESTDGAWRASSRSAPRSSSKPTGAPSSLAESSIDGRPTKTPQHDVQSALHGYPTELQQSDTGQRGPSERAHKCEKSVAARRLAESIAELKLNFTVVAPRQAPCNAVAR
jgi:hypothetical protein